MEHRDPPQQSPPDVDVLSQSHAGGLPRQITPEDVDTRWPFRAGYPRLLRPSVVSIPIEDEAEKPISDTDLDRLKLRIIEILNSHNLPWCTSPTPLPEVVYRRQRFGTSGLLRVLVRCNYDKDTCYSQMWIQAVVEIYAETQSVVKENHEVGVEMVDLAVMGSQICSLPTPMSQELSANWEIGHNYCEKILNLFEAPHNMFQAMVPIGRCCMQSTGPFGDEEPTYEWTTVIFFDALDAETVLWDSLEDRMRSILPSHIEVEIRQRSGPVFYLPASFLDENVEEHIPSPEEYARPPRPGCDIGVQGGRSAGTIGGYIVTEDKTGRRTTYGITNAHVALQSYEKCVFSASADSGIKMVSPSEMSRTKAKSELLQEIPRLESKIAMHKEIIDAWKEKDPDLVQRREKRLKSDESELASATSTLELIEQEPCIGSVQNASIGDTAYSTASSQHEIMMDLALIKMSCLGVEWPEKIHLKEYRRKNSTLRIEPHAVCSTWETDSLGILHDGDGKNHIKVVGKLSRTGVYTFGIVNDFRAVAFPFTENGVENEKKHRMWVVSDPMSYSRSIPFSRVGDSGSFVIAAADWEYCDYDNRVAMPSPQAPLETRYKSMQPFVVGLLFGGKADGGLSYLIPFDAVKSEIESLTGEKMVWPQKRSDCVPDDKA